MYIFTCSVSLSDGKIATCDGIAYEGKLWLVLKWIRYPSKPVVIPERIIRFDSCPHQKTEGGDLDYQNIQLPMPKSALRGEVPQGIEYIDRPQNLEVPIHLLPR
ncbi:hypothetical protein [Nitrosococcus wardiae]|uniref:Uncharacterized protein n=1 Tax=Nitrosococcus wardiae TaxID=1814290 RepID=A0A4P7C137_9GAMM|nr:hypothetical protein [Nitrosococcus wardiae]QBQ55339.1 hypothetical protein E3U44_13090 [Nitrosococcus wardiae]